MLETSKGNSVLITEQSLSDTSNQQERLADLHWITGLWEGEGCFSIFIGSGGRVYASATLPNTDFVLIEELHNALTRIGVGHYINERRRKNPKHSASKTVYVCGFKRVKALLDQILPLLRGEKRKVALVVQRFVERRLSLPKNAHYTSADFADMQEVRSLNKKGPQVSSETIRQASEILSEDIVQVA